MLGDYQACLILIKNRPVGNQFHLYQLVITVFAPQLYKKEVAGEEGVLTDFVVLP